MNALSGLDPKYIDEAAFELHGKAAMQPAQTVRFDAARKARLRRNLLIALPAAAAAFLLIAVAIVFPTLSRLNKSDSASMAESAAPAYEDSAAEAPSYAEEAPSYEEAAAEPEPAYEAEQPQMNEAVTEAEGAAKAADALESAAEAPAPSRLTGFWWPSRHAAPLCQDRGQRLVWEGQHSGSSSSWETRAQALEEQSLCTAVGPEKTVEGAGPWGDGDWRGRGDSGGLPCQDGERGKVPSASCLCV